MRKKAILAIVALLLCSYSLVYLIFPIFSHKIWLSLKILVLSQKPYHNSVIDKPAKLSYELQGQRVENAKTFQTKDGLTWIGTLGPAHYKEVYDDSHSWLDVDLNAKTSTQEYDLYDKLPVNIKIFKNKTGYEIESRETGDKYLVELAQIDGKDATKYDNNNLLSFNFDIQTTGVRLWKELKSDQAPKTFRWKITHETKDKTALAFREETEAFDGNQNLAQVSTKKDSINDQSFYWEESFSGQVKDRDGNGKETKYPIKIDTDINLQVGASSNDARKDYSSGTFTTTDTANIAGRTSATGAYGDASGIRFTNVNIPKSAVINSTYFKVTADSNQSNSTINTKIRAEKADNAATFSAVADWDARFPANVTTAAVQWDSLPTWAKDSEYSSPDIKSVVQEIANRPGWVANNNMVIFWDDYNARSTQSAFRTGYSYDGNSTKAPKLVVSYTPSQATISLNPNNNSSPIQWANSLYNSGQTAHWQAISDSSDTSYIYDTYPDRNDWFAMPTINNVFKIKQYQITTRAKYSSTLGWTPTGQRMSSNIWISGVGTQTAQTWTPTTAFADYTKTWSGTWGPSAKTFTVDTKTCDSATCGAGPWQKQYTQYTSKVTAQVNYEQGPTNAYVDSATTSSLAVHWTDNSITEAYYHVERQTDCAGNWINASITVPANSTTFADSNLVASTSYCYRIHATDGTIDSDYTNTARGSTLAMKLTPSSNLGSATTFRLQPSTANLKADKALGDSRATFVRNSANATYLADSGKLQTIENANDGRIERVTTSDNSRAPGDGVRIEEARTNVLTYSSFEAGSPPTGWTAESGITPVRSTTVIHGSYSVQLTNGTTDKRYYQAKTLTANPYSISAYVQKSGGGQVDANIAQLYAATNLTSSGLSTTYTQVGSTNWYRLTASFTGTAASWNLGLYVKASQTIIADAAQVEVNSTYAIYATSYIPTTTAAATRSAESLTYPTSGNMSASSGTISFWVKPGGWTWSDSNNTNFFSIYSDNNNRLYFDTFSTYIRAVSVAKGTAVSKAIDISAINNSDWALIVYTYSASGNGLYFFQSGTALSSTGVVDSTFASLPADMYVGGYNFGTYYANGLVSDFTIFNTVLDSDTITGLYNGYGPSKVAITSPPTVNNQLTVTWQDNSGNEDSSAGFTVEYKATGNCADATGWTGTTTKAQNTTSYDQAGLANRTQYCLRIRVNTGNFNSPYQASVTAISTLRAGLPPLPPGYDQPYSSDQIFEDIPDGDENQTHWAYLYINALYYAHVTWGCSTNPLRYCPNANVTRAQMASFLVRALNYPYGPDPDPLNPGSYYFTDVSTSSPHDVDIGLIKEMGITQGCIEDDPNTPTINEAAYCPENSESRDQIVAMLIRALNIDTSSFNPDDSSTGVVDFIDVPTTHLFWKEIQAAYSHGFTDGCSTNPMNFCPSEALPRDQMAVLIGKAFGLLSALNANLSGHITNSNGQPIANGYIYLNGGGDDLVIQADADGNYNTSEIELDPGIYEIEIVDQDGSLYKFSNDEDNLAYLSAGPSTQDFGGLIKQ